MFVCALAIFLSTLPEPPVLVWTGGNDAYTMSVTSSGQVTYQVHAGGWGLPKTAPPPRHLKITPREVDRLRRLLEEQKVLSLRPSSRNYVPEERNDELSVAWKGFEGHVSLKDGDWCDQPRAKACADALNALARRAAQAPETKAPRTFEAYAGGRAVLLFSDQPGPLLSTALPPPNAVPPSHPFLSGTALDAAEESKLRQILEQSSSFDGFVEALKKAGYRVAPQGTGADGGPAR